MANRPKAFNAPWVPKRTKEDRDRDHDASRNRSKPWRKWYKLAAWKRLRAQRLAVEPLCRMCRDDGRVTVANVCDHIRPHKGNRALFFDFANTQSLCKPCHDGAKQRMEKAGVVTVDPQRNPSDDHIPIW